MFLQVSSRRYTDCYCCNDEPRRLLCRSTIPTFSWYLHRIQPNTKIPQEVLRNWTLYTIIHIHIDCHYLIPLLCNPFGVTILVSARVWCLGLCCRITSDLWVSSTFVIEACNLSRYSTTTAGPATLNWQVDTWNVAYESIRMKMPFILIQTVQHLYFVSSREWLTE